LFFNFICKFCVYDINFSCCSIYSHYFI
jgi:hypothetical protein